MSFWSELNTDNVNHILDYEHAQAFLQEEDKTCVYHMGDLANDRGLNIDLNKVANLFYRMSEQGKCQLFQKRRPIEKEGFFYFCKLT